MKSNKFISGIKTAGVVLTAAFAMNSCGSKPLSESEMQTVQHKTDSAARVHSEYITATALIDFAETRINGYRSTNKTLLRMYAKDYIKSEVKDAAVAKFMRAAIDNEVLISASNGGIEAGDTCAEDITVNNLSTMRYIRRQQRWYNDLLLYLSDKYTEQQLLNSDFFKVVNNKDLQKTFEYNTQQMENIKSCIEFPLQRKETIYAGLWNKYAEEVKKQR